MKSQEESDERVNKTRISVNPPSRIYLDPKFKTSCPIVIRNFYSVPIQFKFASTGQEFLRADLAKGRIGPSEEITITLTFNPSEVILRKYFGREEKERVEMVRIRFQSRDRAIQIQSILKVYINFDPKPGDQDRESPTNSSDFGSRENSEEMDSVLFTTITQDDPRVKNVISKLRNINNIEDEDNERNSNEGSGKDHRKEDDSKKEENSRPKIKEKDRSEKGDLAEINLKKEEVIRTMFRFFPCYFGCLVIFLINYYIGFEWDSFKATFVSFFVGLVVAYVQFEVFRQEKLRD